jgi:hypothetical protein
MGRKLNPHLLPAADEDNLVLIKGLAYFQGSKKMTDTEHMLAVIGNFH